MLYARRQSWRNGQCAQARIGRVAAGWTLAEPCATLSPAQGVGRTGHCGCNAVANLNRDVAVQLGPNWHPRQRSAPYRRRLFDSPNVRESPSLDTYLVTSHREACIGR